MCYQDAARFPTLKHHDFKLFGRTFGVDYVTPMVCPTCRMMRHPEVKKLGDGRRRFWKRVIALYLNDVYPSAGPRMLRAFQYRGIWEIARKSLHVGWRYRTNWWILKPALDVVGIALQQMGLMLRTDIIHAVKGVRRGTA